MNNIEKCIAEAFEKIDNAKVRTEVGIDMVTVAEAKRIVSEAIECTEVEIINESRKTYKEVKQHY